MNKDTIILSMTTWPPRLHEAITAMCALTRQQHSEQVHFVLTLSIDEWKEQPMSELLVGMENYGVEVIFDEGNILSHKKLIPTLEKYPDNPILVVDDDRIQQKGWLQTFIDDHKQHPSDIIYGISSSRVIIKRGVITEGLAQRGMYTMPGRVTYNEKPANGAAGTLYPAGTFRDDKFFDRDLFMRLSPTSDETWQWAFAVAQRKTFRCLSCCNYPTPLNVKFPLFKKNIHLYSSYHNAIAEILPEYKKALEERIENNPIKYPIKHNEL